MTCCAAATGTVPEPVSDCGSGVSFAAPVAVEQPVFLRGGMNPLIGGFMQPPANVALATSTSNSKPEVFRLAFNGTIKLDLRYPLKRSTLPLVCAR